MCGIIGYVGSRETLPILLKGLSCLEYRGYDSWGIATIHKGAIAIEKDIGKVKDIDVPAISSLLKGTIGLAHSRWATHGKVTRENAHPQTDADAGIAVIHNGIIENYAELKNELENKGYLFSSETDTEVVAHLIRDSYKGNLREAVLCAIRQIEGSYALGVICRDVPDRIIAARNESPLVVGIGNGEQFIASDVPAVLEHTNRVVYLENGEVAELSAERVSFFSLDGKEIEKEVHTITWNAEQAQKQGYPHFMLKEIAEQQIAIEQTINERMTDDEVLLPELLMSEAEVKDIKRVIIVACGTSWHAGLIGEFMLEEIAKIPVEVEYASEFRYRNPIVEKGTIILGISQSGETADTLAALREAKRKGARVISIVNVQGSSITRESDAVLYTHAGPEIGVASTKAFSSQLAVLYLLTVFLGKIRGVLPLQQVKNRIRDLRLLPLQIQSMVDDTTEVERLAARFSATQHALYLGRGINYPIALEGALKLKEVSYAHAEGYPAAEMKHGPIALIDKKMPVVFIATKDDRTYKKIISNIEEVRARGGIVIGIVSKGDNEIVAKTDYHLIVPKSSYILTPLLAVVPLQLLAYFIAVKRGFDPDKPKNLAKSVTVE
ncbi:TPA: glutamine--fructose-6-phosphate transaminase (isomerizing) [Candidatus Woesearchaeota archaeon]|nr:glutamine--fructose-6-phosphate transaminase (isomerizing) [Candidatus Woesearchaeota archaeon]